MVQTESPDEHPLSNVIRLIVNSKNSNAGPMMFIFRSLAVSSASACVFGLVGGFLAPPFLGPALSSMIGMGTGFVAGLAQRWRSDLHAACTAIEEFPDLMKLHVQQMLKVHDPKCTWDRFLHELPKSPQRQGMAIAAVYSASDALATLRAHQQQVVMDQIMATMSGAQD